MKVICIYAEKGGTGKTTTAVHLAEEMAHRGKKVLLLDFDGQTNASTTVMLGAPDDIPTIGDVAAGETRFKVAIYKARKNLWAIPGDRDMTRAEDLVGGMAIPALWLRGQLKNLPAEMFDFVVIDTPPAMSLATKMGLMAADLLLVPVQLEPIPIGGLAGVLEKFSSVQAERRSIGDDIELLGCVATMANLHLRQSIDLMATLKQRPALEGRLVMPIRRTVRVSEASGEEPVATDERLSTTVYQFRPDCSAAEDYRALAAEVIRRAA